MKRTHREAIRIELLRRLAAATIERSEALKAVASYHADSVHTSKPPIRKVAS